MTSRLTFKEKMYICSCIPIQQGIPYEIASTIRINLYNDIMKQLCSVSIRNEIKNRSQVIEKLRKTIENRFYYCKIEPGTMPGAIAGQSIGQPVTQSTLNSFHYSGVASARAMVMGVKKFLEILNATKNPSSSTCTIYYKNTEKCKTIAGIRSCMGNSLVSLTLSKLVDRKEINFQIHKDKDINKRWWFKPYIDIYDSETIVFYDYSLRLYLKKEELYKYRITPKEIVNNLKKNVQCCDISFIPSPLEEFVIDIFVDTQVIQEIDLGNDVSFPNNNNKIQVYLNNIVYQNLNKLTVGGIEGIEEIYYSKDPKTDVWFIETDGSNFKDLFTTLSNNDGDDIDTGKLRTNNMWEVYNLLGIDATRRFLIEEITNFIGFDGTYIDHHHVEILVDSMTFDGNITSVSRYGINRSVGPLAKASFEESMDNLLKAGLYGEIESTRGVSGSVIMGKSANIGTKIISILVDNDMYAKDMFNDEETDLAKIFSIQQKKESDSDDNSDEDSDEDSDDNSDDNSNDNSNDNSDDNSNENSDDNSDDNSDGESNEEKFINPMSFSLYGDALKPNITGIITNQMEPKPKFLNLIVRER